MWKVGTAVFLVTSYFIYSGFIYTKATDAANASTEAITQIREGKMLFQKNNCIACHQVYGLGGYLGPDLTTVYSRYPNDAYLNSVLTTGNSLMPAYQFSETERAALLAYFKHLNNYAPHK